MGLSCASKKLSTVESAGKKVCIREGSPVPQIITAVSVSTYCSAGIRSPSVFSAAKSVKILVLEAGVKYLSELDSKINLLSAGSNKAKPVKCEAKTGDCSMFSLNSFIHFLDGCCASRRKGKVKQSRKMYNLEKGIEKSKVKSSIGLGNV